MTDAQFAALAKLLRLRDGPAQRAVRQVLVDGKPLAEAAAAVGIDYTQAHHALQRVRRGLELARAVTS